MKVFIVMGIILVTRSRPTGAAPARVVVGAQDSFATPEIYKWILMQHLKGFHARTKIGQCRDERRVTVTAPIQIAPIAHGMRADDRAPQKRNM